MLGGTNTRYVEDMNNFTILLCLSVFTHYVHSGPLSAVNYTIQQVTAGWRGVSYVSPAKVMIPPDALLLWRCVSFPKMPRL